VKDQCKREGYAYRIVIIYAHVRYCYLRTKKPVTVVNLDTSTTATVFISILI